jgi:hypothetical protein
MGPLPHIRRLREEGKSFTRRHAKIQRIRLEKHILPQPGPDRWRGSVKYRKEKLH